MAIFKSIINITARDALVDGISNIGPPITQMDKFPIGEDIGLTVAHSNPHKQADQRQNKS